MTSMTYSNNDELTDYFTYIQKAGKYDFLNQVSRRAGNTDPDFARSPVTAVFHQIKAIAGQDVSTQVAKSLSPEMRQMWEAA
ncbi:MAG: hypothetical protein P8183_17680 [Anaerolineae bacterium]